MRSLCRMYNVHCRSSIVLSLHLSLTLHKFLPASWLVSTPYTYFIPYHILHILHILHSIIIACVHYGFYGIFFFFSFTRISRNLLYFFFHSFICLSAESQIFPLYGVLSRDTISLSSYLLNLNLEPNSVILLLYPYPTPQFSHPQGFW